ncbi:hypothetical protein EZJ49_02300 [Bdellovibrio bacteriovorus]|uniref:hypothetical protein n=1 Tax=Bdellovibrio bacteriovorus TaxID=959 RepID=UPI0021CF9D64|nr:hypothetical protein [Bdellovibrio bacteriovorus]UXR65077.1 hypothetical protein EZJ49_02300 [Bdellovibrio bacteriovorus]
MNQETVKKKLLIIKANSTSLGAVEGFLRNREWNIKSTTNLKEALIFLVQEQPQFVMVSIDHPNRKVRNLPKILTQAFPVCVIAFAETNSAASFTLLNNCNTEYILYPPVTGPAVERTVNKYYKDQQTRDSNPAFNRSGNTAEGSDGVISIKGQGSGEDVSSAHSILQQLLSGDDMSAMSSTPVGSSLSGVLSGDSLTQTPGLSAGNSGLGPDWARQQSPTDEHGSPFNPVGSLRNSSPGWAPLEQPAKHTDRPTPEQIENHPSATKKDSIILRGTKDALDKSCVKTSFADSEAIADSTNTSCIVVESPRFSGYLITAMGKDRQIDDMFIAKIRERLFRFLKENGETIEDSDPMQLKIKEVPFEDWALEQAEFLRKSVHNGHEVAMAFFPREDVKITTGSSADEEMASIHLNELAGDVAVEFNVYIYLPKNNKYVLYTPRGSKFFNVQKQRLQSQGVSNLHVLKAEIQDLDKYRAQNFLNEKIQLFEEKLKEKVSV